MMILNLEIFYSFIKFICIVVIFLIIFIMPRNTFSAELLQINDSQNILLGDQNRSLSISLYCVNIKEKDEKEAIELLKNFFPRGTKVKMKPYGSKDGKLSAKIFKINEQIEMTELLQRSNLSDESCDY